MTTVERRKTSGSAAYDAALVVSIALAFGASCFRDFNPTVPPSELLITIESPADGAIVAETPIEVRGTVSMEATVSVNGAPATQDGLAFTAQVALAYGENVITIEAVAPADPTKVASTSLRVTYRPAPPLITIDAPADGAIVDHSPVEVRGSVTIPASVTINGAAATMNGLSFTGTVTLSPGENLITVVATDAAHTSNTDTRTVSVTYAPIRPSIIVEEPLDGAIVGHTPIEVRGTVAIPATITINGAPAEVEGLSFSGLAPLSLGENVITVTATDAAEPSNVESVSLTVVYPPLVVHLDGAVLAADGAYELVPGADGRAFLAGRYEPFDFPATIELVSGASSVSANSQDGTFHAILPAASEPWALTLTESTPAPRTASATLRVTGDSTPPQLTVEGGLHQIVDDGLFLLSGTVEDAQSQVASLEARSSRHPGVTFVVTRGEGGSFYVELPIERGDNVITLVAADEHGNTVEVEIVIVRPSGLRPVLAVSTPQPGSVVETPSIVVEGLVYTSQAPEKVRVLVGDQLVFTQATERTGVLSFRFDEVRLAAGYNALWVRAESLVGGDEVTIPVVYLADAPPVDDPTPLIVVVTPLPGSATADPGVVLTGSVLRGVGDVALTIDGVSVPLFGDQRRFRYAADISAAPVGPIDFQLVATDEQGHVGSATARVVKDLGIPVITITTAGIQESPAVNRVVEMPFLLEGTVRDDNLGSLTLNGEPLRVLPAGQPDLYTFGARVVLTNGQQRTATLVASDRAGNRTTKSVELLAEVPVTIEIVAPRTGTELMGSGAQVEVLTVARLTGITAEQSARASVDGGAFVDLAVAGSTASGTLLAAASDGAHQLVLEVSDASGTVLARARSDFNVVNTDDIPLQVVTTMPGNGASGIEPNTFLTLHFNKVIDPALLSVSVAETAHGQTYDLSVGQGLEFTARSLPPLVEVHRDQEVVGVTPSLFPGNRMISYYLARDLAYGGKVYVTVTYDGSELTRFSFDVRGLPTFLQGLVGDQFLGEVSGITVSLPALNRRATTDANGSFAFGFGDPPEQTLPAGRHRLVINPGLENRRYGSVELWANVEAGRLTQLGNVPLPLLNPDVPFRRLVSGGASQSFAEGALTLDATSARFIFPDGRAQGDVHVQFTPVQHLPVASQSYAMPHWVYAVQPVGVELRGQLGVRIAMPPLFGSHEYVPADGTRVVLLGLDPNAMQLVPVGVGTITAQVIEGVIHDTRLDFLGYALVGAEAQGVLDKFAQGQLALPQLGGALAGATP